MNPTVVDLFSGAGGGSLGFIEAGFSVVGAVEVASDPAASYEALVGHAPTLADIRDVDGKDLASGDLTLLFGCPPCQSFTVLRRGAKELPQDLVRNTLPGEYLRLVGELRPRHFAFENVPGMTEGRWKFIFDAFLKGLRELGYELTYAVVDAADYGVPQHRRRLLVMGSRVTRPRLPKRTHGPGRALAYRTVRDAIGHLEPLASGERSAYDVLHFARRHRPVAIERLQHVPEGGGRADLPERLELKCHREHGGHYDIYGRMAWDRPAPTLTSGCTNVTRGRFAHPEQDRAISLREALLLQTFPAFAPLEGGIECASLQIGNAIPPRLARRIGLTILRMEADAPGAEP